MQQQVYLNSWWLNVLIIVAIVHVHKVGPETIIFSRPLVNNDWPGGSGGGRCDAPDGEGLRASPPALVSGGVGEPPILVLVLVGCHLVGVLQMQRDVFEVVLDLCSAHQADKVLGVDFAASVGRLVFLESETVDLDYVLANVPLFARELAAELTPEPALVPSMKEMFIFLVLQ